MFRDKNINKKIMMMVLLGTVSQEMVASIPPFEAALFRGYRVSRALGRVSIDAKRQIERLCLTLMANESLEQAGEGPEVLAIFQCSDTKQVVFTIAGRRCKIFNIHNLTEPQARTMCTRLNWYMNPTVPEDDQPLRDLLKIENDDEITEKLIREKALQELRIS